MASRNPFEFDLELTELPRQPEQPAVVDFDLSRVETSPVSPAPSVPSPAVSFDLADPLAESWRDVGPQDLSWFEKAKRNLTSVGVAGAAGAIDTAGSAAKQLGYGFATEDDLRAWASLPQEEREAKVLEKSGQVLGEYIAPAWLVGPELDERIEQGGAAVGKTLGELFQRFQQLEDEKILPGFWTQDLPYAIGITGTIGAAALASGVVSGGAVPAWASAAWLGSSLGLDEGINDALNHGATPEQATIAAGVGALLGTTEALPIIRVLDRVDTATGGVISRAVNRVVRQKLPGSIIKNGLKGAFEEGLQEAVQNIGQDTAAMLMYDPDRELTSRAVNAAQVGGGTGFVLSAVASALGIPIRQRMLRERGRTAVRETVTRITGQPVDTSTEAAIRRGAPFTPVPSRYWALQQELGGAYDRLRQEATAGLQGRQQTTRELGDQLGGPIGIDFQFGHATQEAFEADARDLRINRTVETGLPEFPPSPAWERVDGTDRPTWTIPQQSTEGGTVAVVENPNNQYEVQLQSNVPGEHPLTLSTHEFIHDAQHAAQGIMPGFTSRPEVLEALDKQPVVVAGFGQANQQLKAARGKLVELQKAKEETVGSDTSLDEGIKRQEELIAFLQQEAAQETKIAKDLKNLLAGLRGKYLSPDTKILLSDNRTGGLLEPNLGGMYTTDQGKVFVISVDPKAISNYTRQGAARETLVREVALHEFGHGLVYQRFEELDARIQATTRSREELQAIAESNRQPWQVRQHYKRALAMLDQAEAEGRPVATEKDKIKFAAVMREYQSWLEKQMRNPFIERFRSITGPADMEYYENKYGNNPKTGQQLNKNISYWYNFDEFMAENFSRAGTQHEWVTDEAKRFFEEHRALLEEMYNDQAPKLATMPAFTDWLRTMSLEGKIESLVKDLSRQQMTRYDFMNDPEKAKEFGLDPEAFDGFNEERDKYYRWYKYGLNILQLGENNPHIQPLQDYLNTARSFNSKIGETRLQGHETMKSWRKLGKTQANMVGKLLYEQTLGEKHFTDEQLAGSGLSADGIEIFRQVQKDFSGILDRMENVLSNEVRQNLFNDPVEMNAQLEEVRKEFERMRSKPFFPLVRFGRYTIVVRDQNGKVQDFRTFEREKKRNQAFSNVQRQYARQGYNVSRGYLTDAHVSLQGMVPPLLRQLRQKMEQQGTMTEDLRSAFDQILKDELPLESFRRHFTRRKGVAGFSEDAMRAYASYMMQSATHMARVEYQGDLNQAIKETERDSREISKRPGGNGTKRAQIAEMMRDHLDYMLNPTNDWAMLRSIGFVWYLGFNLKSAFVNSTQLFLATHPYLASRFGDVAATKSLGKAVRDFTRYWDGNKDRLTKEQLEMLAQGKADGWLDESLATELAIARSSSGLNESLPVTSGKRAWAKFAEVSAWPFHTVEKMNRALTALAAHDLALKDGLSSQEATALARHAVESTQFEYARWARPKFMRGKVGSNLFLFKNYMQNMLFRALGDHPESSRIMFAMLIMAGGMGLPFAEDLLDVLDWSSTKLKRALGWSNPKVQSRVFLREMLLDMQMNPDLFMYGLGESSMGLGHLGELAGFPIPEIDLQGSLSLGNIVPGTRSLKRLQEGQPEQAFFDFLGDLGGAEAGIMADVANSLIADNPDSWRKWEKSLPSALRQISRAGRYATRGGEETARGRPIADFDPFDVQDNLELSSQMLGFTPSKVSRGWEAYVAERELTAYYETWKNGLLRNHNYARLYEDSDTAREALKAIKEYNRDVPYPEMRIGSDTINRSLQNFARLRSEAGLSIPQQRQFRRLSQDIRALYEEP